MCLGGVVKYLLCCLLLLLGLVSPLVAQEQVVPPPDKVPFPGLAELIPRLAELDDQATAIQFRITAIADTESFAAQLETIGKKQEELEQQIAKLGDLTTWSFESLQDERYRLTEQKNALQKLLEVLSARLGDLDGLSQEWKAKRSFWDKWEVELSGAQQQVSKQAFKDAQFITKQVLESVAEASPPLVSVQKDATDVQKKNFEILNRVESTLSELRQQTFKKTAHSFASGLYYQQFNAELWDTARTRVASELSFNPDFFQEQGWVFALQVILALALAVFIHRHRARAEVAEEWQFILRHPLATGIFVAVATFGPLYSNPPSLWRLFLWGLAVSSAAILTASLLRNPRKIFMVCLLAFIAILSLGLQIVSLPQPIYRLYLALLSLAGIPLLLVLASINQRAKEGRLGGFTLALRMGVVILFVSFVSQFAGFSTLSSRLMDSSIQTVFLGLLTAMGVRLGRGSIDYLNSLEFLRHFKFFRRYGDKVADHLKGVFSTLVVIYVFFYLLAVWGLYDSPGQGWESLSGWEVSVGETALTVKMGLLVVIALYLSLVVSWFLQALLETQFFPGKKLDRGVRDSIKKLLHYVLVLIGFLIAISLAGMDLKAFAVVAGAFGIGIGFGLQNIVNNFISGLILLFERPVKVGDVVVLAGEWGTIKKIGLRSTIMETWDRAEVIVPNSQLISETVTNWTLTSSVARAVVPVGVAYGSDVPLVLEILQEAAEKHPDVLDDPPPNPIFVGFGDSSLDFELRAWMGDVTKRLQVRSDLGQYVERRFREEGVQIPFPQRDLHLRSVDEKILVGKRSQEEAYPHD